MPKTKPPRSAPARRILAAGAVLWQSANGSGEINVAVIHRPRYDDWSLPKGKLDDGESEPVAAVREVQEETGYRAHLGRHIAVVQYPVAEGTKHVRYWAARTVDGMADPGRIVCACFSVGINSLMSVIAEDGLKSIEEIGASLKAGTNCGSCQPELREILRRINPSELVEA